MHALLILFTLHATTAMEPAHLKPGALAAHLGRVALVEDVLWVRYPYASLVKIPGKLKSIVECLNVALQRLQEVLPKDSPLSNELLPLLYSRIKYINDTVTLALENYDGIHNSNRKKRGLIDGIGQLSRMLFGTAMNEDIEKLREQYNQLTYVASANNKAIHLHNRNIAKLEQHINDLGRHAELLRIQLNEALTNIKKLQAFAVIREALSALESTAASLLHTNEHLIRNVVDAARGRVTSSLFPVKDFLHALAVGKTDYNLKPLFDVYGIHHYYPLLESVLTSESIVIHVPFRSEHIFEVHRVEPFPFQVNGTVMTLDQPSSVVLINKDLTMYATGKLSDLDRCQTEYLHLYFCPASLFAFLPVTSGGICEVVLTQEDASKSLTLCPYKHLVPKPFFHTSFYGHHYFFFTQAYYVSVVCPDGSEYKEVSGHFAILNACSLRSDKLNTFPEKLHEGFVSNLTSRIVLIDTLSKVNLANIKFVTNTLSEFNFSNLSELENAVHDSLPVYLSPYVHFPTIIIPIIISLVLLIPLYCCVRKALELYNYLSGRIKHNNMSQ